MRSEAAAVAAPPRPFLEARTPLPLPLTYSHPLRAAALTSHRVRQRRHRRHPSWSRACSRITVEPLPCPLPQWALPRRQQPGTPLGSPPPPLFLSVTGPSSAQQQLRRRRPEASPCPCRHSRVPETPLEVTNLPSPLFSHCLPSVVRDCSSE
jgi:hypothetical protein